MKLVSKDERIWGDKKCDCHKSYRCRKSLLCKCQNCGIRCACFILPCLHRRLCFIKEVYREQCFAGAHLAVIQLAILGGGSGRSVVLLLEELCLFSGEPWMSHPGLTKISPSSSPLKKKSSCTWFSGREQMGEMRRRPPCSTVMSCLLPLADLL